MKSRKVGHHQRGNRLVNIWFCVFFLFFFFLFFVNMPVKIIIAYDTNVCAISLKKFLLSGLVSSQFIYLLLAHIYNTFASHGVFVLLSLN